MSLVLLPGDGIGPEVMDQAKRVLIALGYSDLVELPFGAAALRVAGDPLPEETLAACRDAEAVLVGAVGDPTLDEAMIRPEIGVLKLRQELGVYANLRPAKCDGPHESIDVVVVRELLGGLYYGARGVRADGTAFDTCEYHPKEIERVAREAFSLARSRRAQLTSVDKANILATSRLWRQVVSDVSKDYPDVAVRHMYVDAAAMRLVEQPSDFDVLVSDNLFADILSEIAAGVTGGIGLAPSASVGDGCPGIFEPIHGSAPDIAGRGVANPTGMLRSVVLMFNRGLGRPELGGALDRAITNAMAASPTRDLGGTASTTDFGDAVIAHLTA